MRNLLSMCAALSKFGAFGCALAYCAIFTSTVAQAVSISDVTIGDSIYSADQLDSFANAYEFDNTLLLVLDEDVYVYAPLDGSDGWTINTSISTANDLDISDFDSGAIILTGEAQDILADNDEKNR